MAKKSPKATDTTAEQTPDQAPEVTVETAPSAEQASLDKDIEAAMAAGVPSVFAEPLPPEPVQGEAQPDPTAPINFAEPVSEADLTAAVGDKPEDVAHPFVSEQEMDALYKEAHRDDAQRDFTLKVLKAREPVVDTHVPPPVCDRVAEQTRAEMAAGAKMNKHYEDLHARHGRPRPQEPESKAVFRPGDYVPDPKKNQGHVGARNL